MELIKEKAVKNKKPLLKYYLEDDELYEIGVDEVGRGPLFGRVYTAAVILPKDDNFNFSIIKDSKKFNSKKKIEEVANYIKENAVSWHVSFIDEKVIDEINILQATQLCMKNSIEEVFTKINKIQLNKQQITKETEKMNYLLLIDGNYFNPITYLNKNTQKIENVPYVTVEGGDNKYASIAAASILAKVERDKYIDELCNENQYLTLYYGLDSNKGYGTKKHLEGITEHGITKWHRRTFGICKLF